MEGILHILSYFNPPPDLVKLPPLFPFYKWENWKSEKVTNLLNITQLISSRTVWDAGMPDHKLSTSLFYWRTFAKNAYLFTQLFPVPIGQLPWVPGNSPIEKKVPNLRNLEMDLIWPQGTCACHAFCLKKKKKSQTYCKERTKVYNFICP